MIFTLAFFKGLGERAIKTFAQALVAVIGAGTVGILDVDWTEALSVAALAALVSALTSIGNADFVAGKLPSVLPPEIIAEMADDPAAKTRFQSSVLDVEEIRAAAADAYSLAAAAQVDAQHATEVASARRFLDDADPGDGSPSV